MAATFSGAVFAHGVASHLPALKSVAASQSQPVSRKSVAARKETTRPVCVLFALFSDVVFLNHR
jgi:hypothetical protein